MRRGTTAASDAMPAHRGRKTGRIEPIRKRIENRGTMNDFMNGRRGADELTYALGGLSLLLALI